MHARYDRKTPGTPHGVLALLVLVSSGSAVASEEWELGEPIFASSGWDYVVTRDGAGLPPGRGSAAEGARVYAHKCESCHGPKARGGLAEELVGGIGGLAGDHPDRTVGSFWPYAPPLFDYIRRAMPPDAPLSLTNDEVYALIGYLLSLDGIVSETAAIDAQSLARVRMPNRDGFITEYHDPPPP